MIVDELAGTRILACQGLTAPLALNDAEGEKKKYCEVLTLTTLAVNTASRPTN